VTALGSEDSQVGTAAAQVIAAIANIELPRREWPEIIQTLVQNVTRKDGTEKLAKASLECIGFICEEIDPTVLEFRSNEILTAVCDGMRRKEPHIQLAAAHALYNSLEFIGRNIENETERSFIMQVVCESTQTPEETVCVAAFECLVKLMQLYYDKMKAYMEKGLYQA
jgi:importin subunit beta-1